MLRPPGGCGCRGARRAAAAAAPGAARAARRSRCAAATSGSGAPAAAAAAAAPVPEARPAAAGGTDYAAAPRPALELRPGEVAYFACEWGGRGARPSRLLRVHL
jgi:hypothetical protein